jgi:phage gp16-like protein
MMPAYPASARNAQLAQIHIAKSQLGLADDTYRDMLWTVARVRSAAELDFAGRMRVLEHLRARGFRPAPPRKAAGPQEQAPKLDEGPQASKIRAMWIALAEAGVVRDRSERALLAFVRRQTGVERMEWASMRQLDSVIEALKDWARRAGRLADDGTIA